MPAAATPTESPHTRVAYAQAVWHLARAKMTVISAVTHLCAAVLSTTSTTSASTFSTSLFLRSWLFVLLMQFTIHFLGEVHDRRSDALNRYATPLTGGSRVLVKGLVSISATLRFALCTLLASLLTLWWLVPASAHSVGLVIVVLALSYSTPPPRLNTRALGELDAAIVTSILVPYFSAASQNPTTTSLAPFHARLALIVVPPFLAKIALFLVLNMADRRPDWATGKITLAVHLGDRATALLHAVLLALCYASAVAIALYRASSTGTMLSLPFFMQLFVLPLLLPAALIALRLARTLLRVLPYRLDALLAPTLLHSTLLVWSVLAHTLLSTLSLRTLREPYMPFVAVFAWLTFRNYLHPRLAPLEKSESDLPVDSAAADAQCSAPPPTTTAAPTGDLPPIPPRRPTTGEDRASSIDSAVDAGMLTLPVEASLPARSHDVVVVGGGIAGLVCALTLHKLSKRVLLLERRALDRMADGADLALWPGAITVLRRLGVAPHFFDDECYPLRTVHMCNMDFAGDATATANDAFGAPRAHILKTIDMQAVTEGTGESFVLVSRQRLMDALWSLMPEGVAVFGANVTNLSESEETESVTLAYEVLPEGSSNPAEYSVTARIAIGADGARSKLREHTNPTQGSEESIRFCNEVCYRGVIDFNALDDVDAPSSNKPLREQLDKLFPDSRADATMRINYGAGLRSSFGYMSADGSLAYWWVKEIASERPGTQAKLTDCKWPQPLKQLHDMTPDASFYVHAIEDSRTLERWSSHRVALIGDAAHVVTPNMGQGACLAAEDGFVLGVLLGEFWSWPDGHVEAFYKYEFARKPFAEAVAAESRKQLFLGQLVHPWAVWIREMLIWAVPTSVLQKTLRKNNFEVREYIEMFEQLVLR